MTCSLYCVPCWASITSLMYMSVETFSILNRNMLTHYELDPLKLICIRSDVFFLLETHAFHECMEFVGVLRKSSINQHQLSFNTNIVGVGVRITISNSSFSLLFENCL